MCHRQLFSPALWKSNCSVRVPCFSAPVGLQHFCPQAHLQRTPSLCQLAPLSCLPLLEATHACPRPISCICLLPLPQADAASPVTPSLTPVLTPNVAATYRGNPLPSHICKPTRPLDPASRLDALYLGCHCHDLVGTSLLAKSSGLAGDAGCFQVGSMSSKQQGWL